MKQARFFFLCSLVLRTGSISFAQTGSQMPAEIVTDRPDQTESSAVVPRNYFQAEIGWGFSRIEPDGVKTDSHEFPATLVRIGLLDRAELRLGWEGVLWEQVSKINQETSSGVGDTAIGTKLFLWGESGWIPETALLLGVAFPTGTEDFSRGRVDPGLRFAMSNQLTERLGLGYNLAIDWESFLETAGDRDTRPSFSYSAAGGIGVTSKTSVFLEIFGRAPLHESVASQVSFHTGITYPVLGNFQLDASGGVGLNAAAPDWFTGAGFSFRLPR
jgi:hypothetical protein